MASKIVSTGVTINGVTTIIWGVSGVLQSPVPAGGFAGDGFYMVESVDQSDKVEQVYGENGEGVESWRVLILHGKRWNITVTDDAGMPAPTIGSTITIVDMLGDKSKAYTAVVINNDFRGARKQAGQRILQVENCKLIDSQATS